MSAIPAVLCDAGPLMVLAWAKSLVDPLILMDDEVARAKARRLKLRVRGTLGTLVYAHRRDLLSLGQVELLIEEIVARPDIWIGAKLRAQVLASLRESGA